MKDVQKEIIDLFSKYGLYGKNVPKKLLEDSGAELSGLDTTEFVRALAKEFGDTHSFIARKSEAGRSAEESFDFQSSIHNGVAHIAVQGVFGSVTTYERYMQKLIVCIAELASQHPKSWIIDLSKNWGGNMWPMLASLYSFFPTSSVIGFVEYADGRKEEWKYSNGSIYSGTKKISDITDRIEGLADMPVQVKIGQITASSGEVVAIAFKSRANTTFTGEKTAGFTTGNDEYVLSDGSTLWLCTSRMKDVHGNSYPDGVTP